MTDKALQSILHRLTKRLSIRKPIILSEVDTIQSPIVFGEQEIVLPNGFALQYDDEQVEAALAHELGHILRKDSLWRKTIIFYNSLFYFQPLNQVLFTKINQIAEQRSDQFAEESTGNSRELAEALLITAKNNLTSSQNQWVPAMKSNKSQLLTRVEALLSSSVNRTQSSTIGLCFTFSLSSLVVKFTNPQKVQKTCGHAYQSRWERRDYWKGAKLALQRRGRDPLRRVKARRKVSHFFYQGQ